MTPRDLALRLLAVPGQYKTDEAWVDGITALIAAAKAEWEEAARLEEGRARDLAEGYALERKWATDAARVKEMVDRFLGWKLPKDFAPDCGISFNPLPYGDRNSPMEPIGTNLFNAAQARAMVEYIIATQPQPAPSVEGRNLTPAEQDAYAKALENIATPTGRRLFQPQPAPSQGILHPVGHPEDQPPSAYTTGSNQSWAEHCPPVPAPSAEPEAPASEDWYTELDDNVLAALTDAADDHHLTPAFYLEVAEDYRRALLSRAPRAESAVDYENLPDTSLEDRCREAEARAEAAEKRNRIDERSILGLEERFIAAEAERDKLKEEKDKCILECTRRQERIDELNKEAARVGFLLNAAYNERDALRAEVERLRELNNLLLRMIKKADELLRIGDEEDSNWDRVRSARFELSLDNADIKRALHAARATPEEAAT